MDQQIKSLAKERTKEKQDLVGFGDFRVLIGAGRTGTNLRLEVVVNVV